MRAWPRTTFPQPSMRRNTSEIWPLRRIPKWVRSRALVNSEWGGFSAKEFLRQRPKSLLALDIAENVLNSKIYEDSASPSTSFHTAVGNVEFMPFRMLRLGSGDGYSRACSEFGQRPRSNRPPLKLGAFRLPCAFQGSPRAVQYLQWPSTSSLTCVFLTALPSEDSLLRQALSLSKPLLRLSVLLPKTHPSGRVLGKAFDLCGLYGKMARFQPQTRSSLRLLRLLHQPLVARLFTENLT